MAAIDTLTTFLPGRNEASAGVMMESLLPLRELTERGVAVLLSHHPAKGRVLAGQGARGSGALASFSDINLEMSCYRRQDPADRRRSIRAWSRYDATPRELIIELDLTGTDYQVLGDVADEDFQENWRYLEAVLEDADDKKTRHQLLAEWPADFPKPHPGTLHRWLVRAATCGMVRQEGTGRRADPFRYWLPSSMRRWREDPTWVFLHQMDETQRRVEEQLAGRRRRKPKPV